MEEYELIAFWHLRSWIHIVVAASAEAEKRESVFEFAFESHFSVNKADLLLIQHPALIQAVDI